MEAVNGLVEIMRGCVKWMEIEVAGMKTWGHTYVVDNAPYDLLLGLPWHESTRLQKMVKDDSVEVVVHNPRNLEESVTVRTITRDGRPAGARSLFMRGCFGEDKFEDLPPLVNLDNKPWSEDEEEEAEDEMDGGLDVQF
jgi:hypothetical protein